MRTNWVKHAAYSILIIFLLALVCYRDSYAVPASPDISEIVQPDGHIVHARVKGDEWNNRVETLAGYSIKKGGDGFWYYISRYDKDVPVLSNTPAHKAPMLGHKKHLRPDKKYRRSPREAERGNQNSPAFSPGTGAGVSSDFPAQASSLSSHSGPILFILAEFTNRSGTYSESSFASFITNDIADYYDKASYGNVTLIPADESFGTANNGVVGWVSVGYPHPNTGGSIGDANRQLTRDAILAADPFVNFSSYDTNSDGHVDPDELAVVIIAAGYETAYDGGVYTPTLWGHKWSLGWGAVNAPSVDGVLVADYHGGPGGYAQFGEIHRSSPTNAHQATMGIMVHELGHLIFGLPDLYDTDGSSEGIGAFGIMASGSWGRASSDTYSGETPVLPSAWTKYNIGWAAGTEKFGATSIIAAGSVSVTSTNSVYMLLTDIPNEYFLVENRQPYGYDRGLERWLGSGFGGLAIWHIDEAKTNNAEECSPPSNCSSAHYRVSLEQADGNWDLEKNVNRGNATDLWYLGNAVTFDENSTPDSDLYDGTLSNVGITNISAAGETMTADLAGLRTTFYEENFENGSFGAEWSTSSSIEGRILLTTANSSFNGKYHVTMDDTTRNGVYSLNELILTIDLTGESGLMLVFYHKEFLDEDHIMSAFFIGSENSDGVAISDDGTSWHRVQGLTGPDGISTYYTPFVVDLDAAVASAGISYNSSFKIKFQQYDNYPIGSDGFAIDEILITAPVLSCVDNDGDGYGDPGSASCQNGSAIDCNDSDPAINPDTYWYQDGDGDN
jgi:M6 family metalloprotease-like protein